ncbi:hypothetical protein C475_10079 [Halosimplex carlsbadense 2-9-1]|uniref:Uncharacterized protein n=1 Tax=Halosimplex carlsbadense 2-9-1 TaxID=797114 RepID=M0CV71_9EURY|nr:hypothetical protein [Halosimplex carlsbadense]ELZ25799.1 hypothetical protein C475_10079 [Halosimplex carlsbadense 2-9-1]
MNAPPSAGPDRDPRLGSLDVDADIDFGRSLGGRGVRLAAAAVGAVAFATALALVTGVGGERFADAVDAVVWPARPLVYFVAHFALVLGAWSLWRGRSTDEDADVSLPDPADADGSGDRLVGDAVDEVLDALGDPETTDSGWRRVDAYSQIRSLAIDVLREAGTDDPAAALATGEWTDDPRAAAYLGDDVPLPVRIRVADWAGGDPYRRQVEATVAELSAVAGVETEVAEA